MKCDVCKQDGISRLRNVASLTWACLDCASSMEPEPGTEKKSLNFRFVETVNLKNYPKNRGNVSKARVEMFKRRRLCPDGNGEVIMVDRSGKYTDRRAVNY